MARAHDTMMNPPIEDLLDTRRLQVQLGHPGGSPGPPDQLVLQPARRWSRPHGAAAGQLDRPQAAEHRLRGDRRSQDRSRRAAGSRRRGCATRAPATRPSPDRPAITTAMLAGKRIVLGVTGGIAAYKAVEICRRLVDAGAHVIPVMTQGRRALPRHHHAVGAGQRAGADQSVGRVRTDPAHRARAIRRPRPRRAGDRASDRRLRSRAVDRPADQRPAGHSRPGDRLPGDAHRDVGAPGGGRQHRHVAAARRRTSSSPTKVASPAATRAKAGWPPRSGSSPKSSACSVAARSAGVHVVVTAGGTREPIDAVRVIANRSSGKQGYAVAAEALALGARVTLVSTVDLPVPPGATLRVVETAAADAGRGRRSWLAPPTS